ncbi:hypothetical protein pEaSNUABM5_00232 [Erwinia phage pEa_SNUABM_5]|uniref:Uncharacterized protein n=1 Tax=Erwinia phage pEa_SNUABM_5 TaxID=2797313 RepID=A0A7T8EQ69_9CAUD|nr:hypothetical protein MPK73_gp232 [Erwinia phage pEa_SNUABM_5]QQO90374.1 hypothetical protein pEaSNUABM5_00232 [Erwinia phage pEa_SNUABM_5]
MAKVKPITLRQYMDDTDLSKAPSLFVINRTSTVEESLGNISFSCLNDMGQQSSVTIHATGIPLDLTSQVPAENLVRSSHFRRILEKGQARIVTTESALTYIKESPVYQEEYDRVYNIQRAEDADFNGRGSRSESDEEIDLDGGLGSRRKKPIMEGEDYSSNMFVNAFIHHCNDDSYTDKMLSSEFLSKGMALPRRELEILMKNVNRQEIRDLVVQVIEDLPEGE